MPRHSCALHILRIHSCHTPDPSNDNRANADLWHVSKFEWLILQLFPSGFSNFQFRVLPNVESDSSSDLFGTLHWGWVVPDTSAPSQFCQEVGEENVPGDILVFLSIGIFEVVVWCVTYYQLLSYSIPVLGINKMGHTFPTAVSVGITLGKLCSIYETSFGEVEARISSSLYLLSHIPAGPLELTEEERQGKGGS
jgi:hypothetical protein